MIVLNSHQKAFWGEENMKKQCGAFLFVFLLGVVPAFSARGNFSLALSGEAVMPIGDFSKSFNGGFGFGVMPSYQFIKMLSVFTDFTFQFIPRDNSSYATWASVSGGAYRIFSIVPGIKVIFPAGGKVEIFGLSGFGIFIQSRSDLRVSAPGYTMRTHWSARTNVGLVLGTGMEFGVSKSFSLFPEVRITLILLDDDTHGYISFRFGGKYEF